MRQPLVSIVIPAYKGTYFFEALSSAALQVADFEIEIVVGDDYSGTEISSIVDRVKAISPHTIKYHKNAHRLGELENLKACIKRSSGMFTKPLSDDDFLLESCVQSQAELLNRNPSVAFVTSHRLTIDHNSQLLKNNGDAFKKVSDRDAKITGASTLSILCKRALNFIGEPSCVTFRKNDFLSLGDRPDAIEGLTFRNLSDLAIWVNLLKGGERDFLYQGKSQVFFRWHPESIGAQGAGVLDDREKFCPQLVAHILPPPR